MNPPWITQYDDEWSDKKNKREVGRGMFMPFLSEESLSVFIKRGGGRKVHTRRVMKTPP